MSLFRRWRARTRRTATPRASKFEEWFEAAVSSAPTTSAATPWDDVARAAASAEPLHVRCVARDDGAVRVSYRGLEGRLLLEGARWDPTNPPEEARVWVLKFDQVRGDLVFIAWDPRTGPDPARR